MWLKQCGQNLMKKIIFVFLFVLALFFSLVNISYADRIVTSKDFGSSRLSSVEKGLTKPTIRIGIYAPFSGSYANIGNTVFEAVTLALHQLPIHRHFNYVLIKIPQPNDSSFGENSKFEKLIYGLNLNAVISVYSQGGWAVLNSAKKHHFIHIGIASDEKNADGIYNFINYSPLAEQFSVMLKEFKRKKIKTVCFISSTSAWADLMQKATQEKLKNFNIKVLAAVKVQKDLTDFYPIVTQLKSKKPDIYIIYLLNTQIPYLVKAFKQENISTPFTTITTFNPYDDISVMKGQWYVDAVINKSFREKFYKQYKEYPTTDAAYAFDSFNILVNGFEHSFEIAHEIPTAIAVSKAMHRFPSGQGSMGSYYIQKNGIIFTKSYVIHVGTVNGARPVEMNHDHF